MHTAVKKTLFLVSRIGANPDDDRDLRLQKSLLVFTSFHLRFSATIPATFAMLSTICIFYITL